MSSDHPGQEVPNQAIPAGNKLYVKLYLLNKLLYLSALALGIISIYLAVKLDDISEIITFKVIFGNCIIILSLFCLFFWMVNKYDVSLAFSLLGVLFCGFLMFLEAHSFSAMYLHFGVLYTTICTIFAVSSVIGYRYYRDIFLKEKQARIAYMQYYQPYHPRRERFSKEGIVSILLAVATLQYILDWPYISMIGGFLAMFSGLLGVGKRDRLGWIGLMLGAAEIAGGIFVWLYHP
jgi:hypothetical protein